MARFRSVAVLLSWVVVPALLYASNGVSAQSAKYPGRDTMMVERGDHTSVPVHWSGADDISPVAGKKVRLRFHLTSGRLYAFWISPDASGASYGYVAAGGPGFTSNRDTVGTPGAHRLPPDTRSGPAADLN